MKKSLVVFKIFPKRVWLVLWFSLAFGFLSSISIILVGFAIKAFLSLSGGVEFNESVGLFNFSFTDFESFYLFFGFVVLFYGFCGWGQQFLNIIFNEEFSTFVRSQYIALVLLSPIFANKRIDALSVLGDLLTRSGSFVTAAGRLLTVSIQFFILGIFLIVSDWALLLWSLLALSPLALVLKSVSRMSRIEGSVLQRKIRIINGEIERLERYRIFLLISGVSEKLSQELIFKCRNYLYNFERVSAKYTFGNVLPTIYGLFVIVGIFYWRSGSIEGIPIETFFILYQFLRVVAEGFGLFNALSINSSGFINMVRFLDECLGVCDTYSAGKNDGASHGGQSEHPKLGPIQSIRLNKARFGYQTPNGVMEQVTMHTSIDVSRGEVLVLSGESGSGKSTVLLGMMGLINPTDGCIFINEQDLSTVDLRDFRDRLAYVGPEAVIIDGSYVDNLLFGAKIEIAMEEMVAACKIASAHFLLDDEGETIREGLLTFEGAGLSTGQKQRLAIARALLRSPEVLVLDEATSNLDGETEYQLLSAITNLSSKPIVVMATHGAIPKRFATRILKLEALRIEG